MLWTLFLKVMRPDRSVRKCLQEADLKRCFRWGHSFQHPQNYTPIMVGRPWGQARGPPHEAQFLSDTQSGYQKIDNNNILWTAVVKINTEEPEGSGKPPHSVAIQYTGTLPTSKNIPVYRETYRDKYCIESLLRLQRTATSLICSFVDNDTYCCVLYSTISVNSGCVHHKEHTQTIKTRNTDYKTRLDMEGDSRTQ